MKKASEEKRIRADLPRGLRWPPEQWERVRAAADAAGQDRSSFIRAAALRAADLVFGVGSSYSVDGAQATPQNTTTSKNFGNRRVSENLGEWGETKRSGADSQRLAGKNRQVFDRGCSEQADSLTRPASKKKAK